MTYRAGFADISNVFIEKLPSLYSVYENHVTRNDYFSHNFHVQILLFTKRWKRKKGA